MRLSLYTWDGNAINDGTNYEAVIPPGNAMPAAAPTFIDLGQGNPALAGKTLGGGLFTFHIICRGTGATFESQRDAIGKLFRPNDFNLRKLIAKDIDDSNREWYLEGFPITGPMLLEGNRAGFAIQLALSQPYWLENVPQTYQWDITASGQTHVFAARGNIESLPTIEITPTSAKSGGYGYKRFIGVYLPSTSTAYGPNYPVDLTDGGWNTSTLVGAGKMQADGDDCRVFIDGAEVPRWFGGGGINSATTTVWVNMALKPSYPMTLSANIAGSGTVATITAVDGAPNFQGRNPWTIPPNGTLLIGSEVFTYSAFNQSTFTFTITSRAAKSTSMGAHTAGDTIYTLFYDVWIEYGNSSATAPVQDESRKPVLDLANSTNTSFVFDGLFGDTTGLRNPFISSVITKASPSSPAEIYTGTHYTQASDWSVIGAAVTSYPSGNVLINDTTWVVWQFNFPADVTDIEGAGEKYRTETAWAGVAAIEKSASGAPYTWATVSSIATPSVVDTWEAVTLASTALGSGYRAVRLRVVGNMGTTAPQPWAYVELNTLTFTLDSADVPQIMSGASAETSNYSLSPTISNGATGDAMILNVLAELANRVTIDCQDQLIYSADGKRIRGMLSFNTKRDEWFSFSPGNNTVTYTDSGTAGVTLDVTWAGRNTL